VVDVPNRPHVQVRLAAVKLLFGHLIFSLSAFRLNTGAARRRRQSNKTECR
jgi:hypothetical protein